MSDPKIPVLYPRSTPSWQAKQRSAFWSVNDGQVQPFNTRPDLLEKLARDCLSRNGRLYAESNAGASWTHMANREAFFRHRIIPKQLVDTNHRDTSCELFGHKVAAPFGFAPIGINKIYHPLGEKAVASVAGQLRLPYGLSTAGSTSIEEVARANESGREKEGAVKVEGANNEQAVRFFQLYMPHDDEMTISLLTRAVNSGFSACILTTDTWQLAWRHDDVYTSNYAFYRGIGADLGLTDPVFKKRLEEMRINPQQEPEKAGAAWIDNVWHGRAFSWDKIPWLIKKWKEISGGKPFLLKGIQDVDDAWRAVEVGCDGIVVSNHAGRQVDGAIASLDALDAIIKAGVGEKITVTYDSGVRGVSDIIKALCLGAKFVWIGRLWIWGLSIMGEAGVSHVMTSLLAEFDIAMAVGGFKNVGDFKRERLETFALGHRLQLDKWHRSKI